MEPGAKIGETVEGKLGAIGKTARARVKRGRRSVTSSKPDLRRKPRRSPQEGEKVCRGEGGKAFRRRKRGVVSSWCSRKKCCGKTEGEFFGCFCEKRGKKKKGRNRAKY